MRAIFDMSIDVIKIIQDQNKAQRVIALERELESLDVLHFVPHSDRYLKRKKSWISPIYKRKKKGTRNTELVDLNTHGSEYKIYDLFVLKKSRCPPYHSSPFSLYYEKGKI